MSDKKVVLIAANGQLGTEWAQFFKGRNIPFVPYTIDNLDITDFVQLESVLDKDQPEFVINASAYTQVDRAETDKEIAYSVNTHAVANMARACKQRGIKLVHYSTDYIFPGRSEDKNNYPDGYTEDAAADPINVYGKSKWEGEEAIRNVNCSHLIIRVAWLCGAYGNNFVRTMLRLGKERRELKVVGDQYGSPSFTPNVVANSWLLLKEGKSGMWHITSEGLLTWYDLASEALSLSGINTPVYSITTEEYPTPAPRPRFSKLSIDKLKTVDGALIEDWHTGLRDLVYAIENQ